MLKKIKIIIRISVVLFVLLTPVIVPNVAQAVAVDDSGNKILPGSSIPTECDGKTGNDYNRCAVCHPEISGGSAFTDAQLASCKACVSANLNPDPATKTEAQKDQNASVTCLQDNVIVKDLNMIITILTGLVGIVVIGNIILGGIQYSFSSGKQDSTANAKKRIIHSFVALVAFLLIWGFLQWLVPGGVF